MIKAGEGGTFFDPTVTLFKYLYSQLLNLALSA